MHHCDKQKTTSVFLSFTYQCISPEKRLCVNFIAKKDYIYVLNKFAICLPQIKKEIKYSFYAMTNVFFIYDFCLMGNSSRIIMKSKSGRKINFIFKCFLFFNILRIELQHLNL